MLHLSKIAIYPFNIHDYPRWLQFTNEPKGNPGLSPGSSPAPSFHQGTTSRKVTFVLALTFLRVEPTNGPTGQEEGVTNVGGNMPQGDSWNGGSEDTTSWSFMTWMMTGVPPWLWKLPHDVNLIMRKPTKNTSANPSIRKKMCGYGCEKCTNKNQDLTPP